MRTFALLLLTVLPLSLNVAAQPRPSIGLIAAGVGWAVQGPRLLWTNNNGGNWVDITPHDPSSKEIAGVFFLDASRGWVLFTVTNESGDVSGFDFASTADGGADWTLTHLTTPPQDGGYAANGKIFFLDSTHGWMNLALPTHLGGGEGRLLETNDGGQTWTDDLGFTVNGGYGAVRFIDTQNGWIAGGPNDEHLYVTHDGGQHWNEGSVPRPSGASTLKNIGAVQYGLPTFKDTQNGFLPLTYSGTNPSGQDVRVLSLFSTQDGGRTWQPRVEANLGVDLANLAFTAIDSVGIAVKPLARNAPLAVVTLGAGGTVTKTVATEPTAFANALDLSFVDATRGWAVLDPAKLLSTTDGGATWKNITPAAPKANTLPPPSVTSRDAAKGHRAKTVRPSTLPISSPLVQMNPHPYMGVIRTQAKVMDVAGVSQAALDPAHKSQHLGFDTCDAPRISYMQNWWDYSPYYDIGIYLGNASDGNMGCPNQTYLNSSWISSAISQGWGLLPIWVGPQAPCRCKRGAWPNCTASYTTYINTDGTAYDQGEAEAATAAAVLSGYALPESSPIYVDIENYDPSATADGGPCGSYVNDFLSGWADGLHSSNYYGGAYGNPLPAFSWHSGGTGYGATSPLPDDVWIAKYDNRVTTWGLGSLDDTAWTNDQRLHQYTGGVTEQWGGPSMNIDNNIEDADATGGIGGKYYSLTSAPFSCGYDGGDAAYGVNNPANAANSPNPYYFAGSPVIVGIYAGPGSDGGEWFWHGFTYSPGAGCGSIPDYPSSPNTVPVAINNQSAVTGWFGGAPWGGFIYNSVSGTYTGTVSCGTDYLYPTGMNDDNQIVATDTLNYLLYPGCTTIDYPGASFTQYGGINGQGIAVGYYELGDGIAHGFTYNTVTGAFSAAGSLDFPGASDTYAYAINDNGLIAGGYDDADGNLYGYSYESASSTWNYFELDENPNDSYFNNFAYGINDTGTIAGEAGGSPLLLVGAPQP